SVIESRRGNRDGKIVEAADSSKIFAGIDYILDLSLFYEDRLYRIFQRLGPDFFDLILSAVETQSIDFLRAGETADEDGYVVFLSLGVVDVVEVKPPRL